MSGCYAIALNRCTYKWFKNNFRFNNINKRKKQHKEDRSRTKTEIMKQTNVLQLITKILETKADFAALLLALRYFFMNYINVIKRVQMVSLHSYCSYQRPQGGTV